MTYQIWNPLKDFSQEVLSLNHKSPSYGEKTD